MANLLIVVDMQNDFVDGALGTKEAVGIVPDVVKKIKTFDGTVLYTKDTHTEQYMETQEGRNLPVIHCVKGTKGWELVPAVKELQQKSFGTVFEKNTFGSTELGEYVRNLAKKEQIEAITLIGLCTDICVVSNALLLKAFLPETTIRVDASCCAGVTKESHETALQTMKGCQIEII